MTCSTRREFVFFSFGLAAIRRRDWTPAYILLGEKELSRRADALWEVYRSCRLCPRQCGANRLKGEKGVCQTTWHIKVASAHPHFGEEKPLVGRKGSGTIFFSNCNLLCEFCQNWRINHLGEGDYVTHDQVARLMLNLQSIGCHNVNLVTPTHVVPSIVQALRQAIPRGFRLPLVYNCGGYDPAEIIRLLDGIVDIYLPDYKYTDGKAAAKYSHGADDYPEVAAAAIKEMHRQVGGLLVDEKGIALRGLIIRHLVMPQDIAGTEKFAQFVARELGRDTYVNIMAQYHPEHRARNYPEINRRITILEYHRALESARRAGLTNLDTG